MLTHTQRPGSRPMHLQHVLKPQTDRHSVWQVLFLFFSFWDERLAIFIRLLAILIRFAWLASWCVSVGVCACRDVSCVSIIKVQILAMLDQPLPLGMEQWRL